MGKYAVFAAIFAALFVGCAPGVEPRGYAPFPIRPSVSVAPLYRSCVQVVSRAADGRINGLGSGTVIGRNRILTAFHVVDDAALVTVERISHHGAWAKPAIILRGESESDLCMLEADTAGLDPAPMFLGDLHRWEACWAVGYAKGLSSPTLTDGRVQDIAFSDMRYSAQGWFGSSGGGVFVVRDGVYHLVSVTQRVYTGGGQVIEFLMIGASPASISSFLGRVK